MEGISADTKSRLDTLAGKNGLTVTMLMEHAGLHLARFLQKELKKGKGESRIVILVGRGHNGGDGLAAARHLGNWGIPVDLILAEDENKLTPASKRQLYILRHIRSVKQRGIGSTRTMKGSDFIICDALLGSGISGDPKTAYARLIDAANSSQAPIIAIDVPSGLDATTGARGVPTIEARATVCLSAVLAGVRVPGRRKYVGRLYVADLGIPAQIYKDAGIEMPDSLFEKTSIVRV